MLAPLSIFDLARARPRVVALSTAAGELTVGDLAERAREAARPLAARGVLRPGRPVALVAAAELEVIATLLALAAHGVPAILLHPRFVPAERARVLAALGSAPLVAPEPGAGLPGAPEPAPVDPEAILAVFTTSGTTGAPKGVALSHRAFAAASVAVNQRLQLSPADRWLLSLPLAHVGGFAVLTRTLAAGAVAVLAPGTTAAELPAVVEGREVSVLSLVPTMLRRLLAREPPWSPRPRLRAVLLGGAAAPPELLSASARRGWPVLTTYGLTEAAGAVTLQSPQVPVPAEPGSANADRFPPSAPPACSSPAAEPLPGVELEVREGRIRVRGPSLLSGLLPGGGSPLEGGWLETGDLGALDERGRLVVFGRAGELIISGGENVWPAEVEAVLRGLPAVEEALVFGVEDAEWGRAVACAVTTRPGCTVDGEVLLAHARAHLAGFKRPRRWVVLEAWPLLPSGKVDAQEVIARATPRLQPLLAGR